MKSIQTKLMLAVGLLVAISMAVVGGTVCVLMYNSSIASLSQTMTTTAQVAANYVYENLETYRAVANETGLNIQLADPEYPIPDKTKILDEKMAQYGFLAGNIADMNGHGVLYEVDISDRDYFAAAAGGTTVISNVLLSKSLNKYTFIVAAPLWEGGVHNSKVIGVVYFNVDALKLSEMTNQIKIGETGSAYMLDQENYTIAHKKPELVTERDNTLEGFKTDPALESLVALESKMKAGEVGFGTYKYGGVTKILAYAPVNSGQGWSIAVNAEQDEFLQSTLTAIFITLGLVVVAIIIGIIIAVTLAHSITRPLIQIEGAASRMAKGDYDVEITHHSKDELGRLAHSMRSMEKSTQAIILDTARGLGEVANGNFDIAPTVEYIGVFDGIYQAMIKIITDLSGTMSGIRASSDQVLSGSEQVSSGAQALAQGATEQASSIQQLSASINEVSQQIRSNAQHAATASTLAEAVGRDIQTSNSQMNEMVGAISEISHSSAQISKIIKTIEDIAFQTNILALNAAVEAARAGAAGKGFAVVADEVRNLATKSSEAAKQTNVLIEGSVKSVENGVRIANATAQSLSGVVSGASEITDLIGKISEASAEQTTSILQINQGVEQISSVVQTNSATSEESAAASEELTGQASMMKTMIAKFKLKGSSSGDMDAAVAEAAAPKKDTAHKEASHKDTAHMGGKY